MKARLATQIGQMAIGEYIGIDQHRHIAKLKGLKKFEEIYDGGTYQCDECGEIFKPDTSGNLYDTPSGELEPGCLYWDDTLPENYYWDNHKGPHLMAILPNKDHWNIDSRASNCGSPDNRTHRCWVRKGTPPNIHVDKEGHTCAAGAGSIQTNGHSNWHGYLHHGEFHT